MSQTSVLRPADRATDDADWLRGRKVVHTLVFALSEPGPCLTRVFAELEAKGAVLESLSVRPTGSESFEAVVRIAQLNSDAAIGLLGRLAELPSVQSAAIEHLLIT